MDIREVIIQTLESQKDIILQTNLIDVNNGGDKIDFDSMVKSLNWFETSMLEVDISSTKIEGMTFVQKYQAIGNIGLIVEDNNINAIVYSIVKSIWCGNNVKILLDDMKNFGTIKSIVLAIDSCIKLDDPARYVEVVLDKDVFVKNVTELDLIIVISSKTYYNDLLELVKLPIKYIPFAKGNFVITNEDLYNKANKEAMAGCDICTTFELEGAQLVADIKEAVFMVNTCFDNYKTILLSDNKEDIEYFIQHIKSDIVVVNNMNSDLELPNLNQYDLLKLKNYFI